MEFYFIERKNQVETKKKLEQPSLGDGTSTEQKFLYFLEQRKEIGNGHLPRLSLSSTRLQTEAIGGPQSYLRQ